MTADERTTLLRYADNAACSDHHDMFVAEAIESALAEIERLTAQVRELESKHEARVSTILRAQDECDALYRDLPGAEENCTTGASVFMRERILRDRAQVATLTAERDEALARAMNAETEASIFRDDLAGAVAALRGEPQPRGLTDVGLDLFYGIEALKSGTTPRVKENP